MLREEWRLHSELFGGGRFGAFPLAIGALTAVGTWLLGATGTAPDAVLAGMHGLVLFFGLQVGTIGLVGRDALRDVLGDVTLLVFSARTLPLSWRRLLTTFLVKDLCYYGGLMLAPAVLGFGVVAVSNGLSPAIIGFAWLTVTISFALGVAISLTLAALATRSPPALLATVALATTAVVRTDVNVLSLTPLALFADPSPTTLATGVGPVLVLGALGVLLFEPSDGGDQGRKRSTERIVRAVAPDHLTRRPLLAVARSSGSVAKVLFSMGVLFAVTALVLRQVAGATGIAPHAGIAFGTLLGLGAFTTYSWVTQFDDPREYLRYPVSYAAVFAGKRRAYLLLSVGAGIAYLALATIWYPPTQLAVGILVLPLVSLYVFGVAAYITGLSPNELLFDTPLFAVFGGSLAVVTIPLIVAALANSRYPTWATAVAGVVAVIGGVVGIALSRRAGPRWDERLRE